MSAIAPSAPKSILLIDDDELIAGSLRQILVMGGADVDVALDPSSALSLMTTRSYDVVLIDPYLTGGVHRDSDLIDRVHVHQPAAKMIVLTGYSSPELVRAAADGGVAALIAKPQSISFLAQFLAGTPQNATVPEPSIKGRPV